MKLKLFSISAILAVTLASCSDVVHYDEDVIDIYVSNGAPEIDAVFDVADTESTTPLESGSLNQMIRIEGRNLSQVESVTFNGIAVDVKQIYATSAASYLKIPRTIPEQVTNELVYTTSKGSIRVPFEVTIPHLRIEGLANEFCRAGQSVEVKGEYFDLFGFGTPGSAAHITLNGTELEVDSITESYMSIVIPEGTPDNSIIDFSWQEVGTDVYTMRVPFRFSKYIFMPDLTAVGWWDAGVKKYITDGSHAGDPESTYGNFFRITGSFDQWSWNTFGGGSNWPDLDCRDDLSKYVFKFEVCSAAAHPFYDSEEWGYYFALNDADNYAWNPSAGVSFNTYGEWRTISIPLNLVAAKNGVPAPGTWANFCMVLQPNTDGGWKVDHSFANFRVEPAEF